MEGVYDMKKYVVILVFSENFSKVLLVKRAQKPYINCWNGIGGKIQENETEIEASVRECKEETNIDLVNPKILVTLIYPNEDNNINTGTNLTVVYANSKEIDVEENYEGVYEWKPIEFALDFNAKDIAGLSNLAQFIKEILDKEGIKKIYD